MTEGKELCSVDEVPPGHRKIVDVNGISIGVFNLDGDFYALLNTCPHQNGPVCEGNTRQRLEREFGGTGERIKERLTGDRSLLECPWHGWTFDIRTGEHIGDREEQLPSYDVFEEAGTLYLNV